MVELLVPRLTHCPAAPSKTIMAILPAAGIETTLLSPIAMRPVIPTSAGVRGAGTIKKSALLTALPVGVSTLTRPDAASAGTLVTISVVVAEAIEARVLLNL